MDRLFFLACFTVGAALVVPSVPAQSAASALQAEAPATLQCPQDLFQGCKRVRRA
jgi:hypothetical protein